MAFLLQCNYPDTMSWKVSSHDRNFSAGGSVKEIIVESRQDAIDLLKKQKFGIQVFTLLDENYEKPNTKVVSKQPPQQDVLDFLNSSPKKEEFDFTVIKGIGNATQKQILEAGFTSIENILENQQAFLETFEENLLEKIIAYKEA